MENNQEFERLIAKSKAQIEEREKMIKELMELNEMEQKRRQVERLTSETRMLESESKRLKDLIKADSHAAEERMSNRYQAPSSRYDDMDRSARRQAMPEARYQERQPERHVNDEARELIALTRELRAELSKHREQVMHPKSVENYRGNEPLMRSNEREDLIHRLNNEIRMLEKNLSAQSASTHAPQHGQTMHPQHPAAQHAPVQHNVVGNHQVVHKAQLSEAEVKELHALREETKKIRLDVDKQKSDNHKRDRDMSRVISLLEQMSRDEDE